MLKSSQSGFAHILLIILLILGIALGVYIIQKQTNLFSKAGPSTTVEFFDLTGNPISQTPSAKVKVKLTSPGWNSSSSLFGIKAAYAQVAPPSRTNPVPYPPEKVTAVAVPCNSLNGKSPVKITWSQPQTKIRPALFYKIEKTIKGTDWNVIGYTEANPLALEFTDANALKNSWFAYRVTAAGTTANPGYGAPSNSNWVLTNNCQVPPHPTPTPTATPTATPTTTVTVAPTVTPTVSAPVEIKTVSVMLSEDPNFTIAKSIVWNTDAASMVIDYTFSTSYPGIKTLYVRFKGSNGEVKDGNPIPATINLVAISTPVITPLPTPTLTPIPSATPIYYIKVTSPNGGETLQKGQSKRITWESNGVDGVYVGYDPGSGYPYWIVTGSPNKNYLDWTINIGNSTKAKIYIYGYKTGGGNVVTDISDDFFNVTN